MSPLRCLTVKDIFFGWWGKKSNSEGSKTDGGEGSGCHGVDMTVSSRTAHHGEESSL